MDIEVKRLAATAHDMVATNLDEDDQQFTDDQILHAIGDLVAVLPENDAIRPTLTIYEHADHLTMPHLRLLQEVLHNWWELHN